MLLASWVEIGIIRPSQSPMASPLVCVLKGRDGRDGVHLKVDYRYVYRDDVFLLPDIGCVFQCRDRNHFIRITDCKTRPWQQVFRVTVHSDHNPLLYVTESAPKSAKLMRWSLSLQEFDVTFKYRAGRANVAADCLSRLNLDESLQL